MSDNLTEKLENLASLDTSALGQLVRAKTLQAVAMHFILRGVKEQFSQGNHGFSVEEACRRMQDDSAGGACGEGDTQ